MKFDEMKKIWDAQNNEVLYAINEDALFRSVTRKKNAASRRIDLVEKSIALINSITAVTVFIDALNDPHGWDYVGSAILASTVIYIFYFRWKRKKTELTFDRTMLGELDHAISNTDSIIKFTYLMVFGYFVPISFFYMLKMLDRGASMEKWLFIFFMFALAIALVTWERKKCHIPRKKDLEVLRDKLVNEE